jgi:hypothetical protein
MSLAYQMGRAMLSSFHLASVGTGVDFSAFSCICLFQNKELEPASSPGDQSGFLYLRYELLILAYLMCFNLVLFPFLHPHRLIIGWWEHRQAVSFTRCFA